MIRTALAAAAALTAFAGSTPATAKPVAAAPPRPALSCDQAQTFPMKFTSADAQDVVAVRTIAAPKLSAKALEADTTGNGARCDNATLLFTLNSGARGAQLFSFATQLGVMDFHNGPEPDGWTPKNTANYLKDWAKSARLSKTDQAPKLGAKDVQLTTSLKPADYAAIAKQGLPMLCLNTSIHDLSCFYGETSGAGGDVLRFLPFYVIDQS